MVCTYSASNCTVLICQYFFCFSVGNTEEFQKNTEIECFGRNMGKINITFSKKLLNSLPENGTDSEMCWLETLVCMTARPVHSQVNWHQASAMWLYIAYVLAICDMQREANQTLTW